MLNLSAPIDESAPEPFSDRELAFTSLSRARSFIRALEGSAPAVSDDDDSSAVLILAECAKDELASAHELFLEIFAKQIQVP